VHRRHPLAAADDLPLGRHEDAHGHRVLLDEPDRGSNAVLGVTMHVAPRVRNGSSPLMPPMWNSGWPESQTSSSPARISWIQLSVPATRLPCVRTAPLGRPVVPDV